MGLIMVEDIAQANAITHGGTFHADEVFATVILGKIMDVRLARVLEMPESLPEDVLVYDIGGGVFDHHQKEKEFRSNGIPYAACGLIWRKYGKTFLGAMSCPDPFLRRVFSTVDKKFIQGIDAFDNGITLSESAPGMEKAISQMLGLFNPAWDEEVSTDQAFLEAVEIADCMFSRIVRNYIAGLNAEDALERCIRGSRNHILVLDRYLPWKGGLLNSRQEKAKELWYVVYPSNRGGFSCQCVPVAYESFEPRHPIPEEWKGNPEATGIADCTFVHQTGFLATFKTKQGAIFFARMAVEAGLEE